MTPRRLVYLALAALGLVLPWYHNLAFMREAGPLGVGAFLEGAFANHASSSIGWDILAGSTAFLVFMFPEAKRLGMKYPWAYLVATLCVAFGFGAPLFLFMREGALLRVQAGERS